ncbi:ferredoxin [Pseudomonas syringae]|uniref:Ferredoxin III n=1 Tax=Pseudomonas syringae TaxID=317 RepID=A0A1C7YXN9_PSESX|nr:ferredoxin III, nif-specific [Pseudomonas syringae]OCR22524.1 ferredoxin [Pseudomonas syringae]
MTGTITGLTRGGAEWTPQFITALDAQKCIGCGRCYKVCPRDVFTLVERGSVVEADDDYDDDDEMQVMTIQNGLDCIGCTSCSRVCPKQCHSHQPAAA